MKTSLRQTRALCPVCLKNLPAEMAADSEGVIFLERTCPEHGFFSVPVWQGRMDFHRWVENAAPLSPDMGENCPGNCGICPEHEVDSCCVLLEVTKRCNLRCRFCFANGGGPEEDPTREELEAAIRDIREKRGKVLLQLSGGEPTLREDLPELVAFAKSIGIAYVQLNTNGIRLAREPEFTEKLAQAGLDIVFLQFDGTEDAIFEALRGQPLLGIKEQAIAVCDGCNLGVTLVPTVVPGVNDGNLGDLVRYAAAHVPAVRGVHFQPVSYFGRYPRAPLQRYTLDCLMADMCQQAGLSPEVLQPSRCDHPLCGFHAGFLVHPDGSLHPLATRSSQSRSCAADNREYVARHWRRSAPEPAPAGGFSEEMDFDTFLYQLRHRSLTLSAMAFQDAGNLNIERLHRCSLHVYHKGIAKPFCANYLSAMPS